MPDSDINLALAARASASESYNDLTPEKAIDGVAGTRWSGIPGHNEGVWYQLKWDTPVTIRQIVLKQYDTFVTQLDIQTYSEPSKKWKTIKHLGTPDAKLPLIVVASFEPFQADRIRIGNICNGPSFNEVEVYAAEKPDKTVLGSDANGNIIGIVCDHWGGSPVTNAKVLLKGNAKIGQWQAQTKTNDHGLFEVAMPLGLTGDINVKTKSETGTHDSVVRASDIQYGLTPTSFRAKSTSLNGQWKFRLDPPEEFYKESFDDSKWSDIKVPAHWSMEGHRSITGIAGYRKTFSLPAGKGRLKLRFDGVYSGAEVWFNGTRVAYHEGGALPFEVDVTDQAKQGRNRVAVRVTEHTRTSDTLDKMSIYADIQLGGIMRKVTLQWVPDVHIGAMALATPWDAELKNAGIQGTISLLNESDAEGKRVTIQPRLVAPNGNETRFESFTKAGDLKAWSRTEVPISLEVKHPLPWNAEQPNLYTLVLDVVSEGKLIQSLKTRVGFRQTEIKGTEVLINGKPVKVRGTCHHDSHPLMGRAVTPGLEHLDCQLIKEANLNSLRTSHYPPLPELLDYADELGIYVEDEGSFCWTGETDDLTLTPRVMQLNCELVARDRNHPSVFMWSICNESTVGFGLWRSREWVQKSDPSRPTGASYQPDGSMDFAVRHNPFTFKEMSELEKTLKVPLIWDECWCIWQDIWGDAEEVWIDPGIRDYYIEPYRNLYKHFIKSPVVQGTEIWAWSDDIFLLPGAGMEYGRGDTPRFYEHEQYSMPGRGVAGDAQWGVVDGWRRKKPEFWHTKKLHSPVKVKETRLPLEKTVKLQVENEYDFLNLGELSIAWQCGSARGTVKPDVAPHTAGTIEFELPNQPKDGDILGLAIADKLGIVDKYQFVFGKPAATVPWKGLEGKKLQYLTQNALNGSTRFIVGEHFEVGVNLENGWLRRGTVNGVQVLRSLPELHFLVTGDPNRNPTDPRYWKAESCEFEEAEDRCVVKVKGSFSAFKASYIYTILPDGQIEAECEYENLSEEFEVREIGLRIDVPKANDLIAWDRNAEFSVYPEDHIGRPRGEAKATDSHRNSVPPKNEWRYDNSPLGTNDFRSTKRNINWGYIGLDKGLGVGIESNGRQALRAMIDGERNTVFVNDFYGGIGSRWEWLANYGSGQKIAKGQKGKVLARIRLIEK